MPTAPRPHAPAGRARGVRAVVALALFLSACGPAGPSGPPSVPPPLVGPSSVQIRPVGSPGQAPSPATPPVASPRAAIASPAPTIGSPAPATVHVALSDIRLPSARSRGVALVLGSRILIAGGLTKGGTTTGSILTVDPRTGGVASTGNLAAPVHDAGGAVLGHVGLVIGGGRLAPGRIVQRLTSASSTRVGRLPAVRADLAAVSIDGTTIVVVGGGTTARPDDLVLATTDGRRFRTIGKLRVGVRYPAVTVADGIVYVIGGSTPTGDSRLIQAFDPHAGVTTIAGHLPVGLSHASAVMVGGAMLVAGGRTAGRARDTVWQIDPTRGSVTRAGRLPYAVSDAAAAVVDGTAYVIGGEGQGRLASIITIAFR